MPVVNPLARELVFKVVYYGPGLGGKTTTLQYIHTATRPEHRGKMVSLATPVDRTLYFDFLPIRLPNVQGLGVRLQLFTVPGQVYYNATRKLVLTGADAVVFVADSQQARLDANLESLENLRDNLREHGRSLAELPFAFAYNKRDLSEVTPVDELERRLNRHGAPYFETCATTGEGVFETLDTLARLVLEDFERRMPDKRTDGLPGNFRLAEGGLVEALRAADHELAQESPQVLREGSEAGEGEHAARAVLDAAQGANRPGLAVERASTFPAAGRAPAAQAGGALRLADSAGGRSSASSGIIAAATATGGPGPGTGAVSFLALWPEEERALAHEVEGNLQRGEWSAAVLGSGALVRRCLARQIPQGEEAETTAVVLLAFGIDAARYLGLRHQIAAVRGGTAAQREDALAAYLFALDVAVRTHPSPPAALFQGRAATSGAARSSTASSSTASSSAARSSAQQDPSSVPFEDAQAVGAPPTTREFGGETFRGRSTPPHGVV